VWDFATRTFLYAFVFSIVWVVAYRFLPAPFTLIMVGETFFQGREIRHRWVPLERISPHLIRAPSSPRRQRVLSPLRLRLNELEKAWDRSQRRRPPSRRIDDHP
jgi:monofunctional biosynthetic peptidoglycan transglycosylase